MRVLHIRTIVLACFLLFAAPAWAQNDILVMKNGDRLSGKIKWLNGGALYMSLDYVDGTISLQWSQVAHLESTHLFIVATRDGSVYTGLLSTNETRGDQPVKFQVAVTPEKKVELAFSQIVAIKRTATTFTRRLDGDISAGVNYAKGNNSTQYNFSSTLQYPRDRWLAQASFDSILSSSKNSTASTRNQVTLNSLHLLGKNYFYAGGVSFLQSSAQSISRQTTLGGGIGRFIENTERARVSVLGGLAWQRTNYEASSTLVGTQNVAAALIRAEAKLFKFKKVNLNASADFVPAISEPGRVYFKTNSKLYVKFFGNLSWTTSFYGNWDNRPPGGLSGSDYGSSSGLSWRFGNW